MLSTSSWNDQRETMQRQCPSHDSLSPSVSGFRISHSTSSGTNRNSSILSSRQGLGLYRNPNRDISQAIPGGTNHPSVRGGDTSWNNERRTQGRQRKKHYLLNPNRPDTSNGRKYLTLLMGYYRCDPPACGPDPAGARNRRWREHPAPSVSLRF